jgi:Arm DNA-binding domain
MPPTDTAARNAKAAAKTEQMFDRNGLYFKISPRGGKWWRLKYRHAGKEKRVALENAHRALGNCLCEQS